MDENVTKYRCAHLKAVKEEKRLRGLFGLCLFVELPSGVHSQSNKAPFFNLSLSFSSCGLSVSGSKWVSVGLLRVTIQTIRVGTEWVPGEPHSIRMRPIRHFINPLLFTALCLGPVHLKNAHRDFSDFP